VALVILSLTCGFQMKNVAKRAENKDKRGLTGQLDGTDAGVFRPESWLKGDKEGVAQFDPMAGLSLPFGAGARACFGRRFAQHELKIRFGLTVWHFYLEKASKELSEYEAVQRFARLRKVDV